MTVAKDPFVAFQFELSTAESEKQYFSETTPTYPTEREPQPETTLPAGVYRVIDGQLYLLVAEPPFFS